MTAYQRRLRDIKFLQQRGEDLEAIVFALAQQVVDLGATPALMLGSGIDGDRSINDISAGDFSMRVISSLRYTPPPTANKP